MKFHKFGILALQVTFVSFCVLASATATTETGASPGTCTLNPDTMQPTFASGAVEIWNGSGDNHFTCVSGTYVKRRVQVDGSHAEGSAGGEQGSHAGYLSYSLPEDGSPKWVTFTFTDVTNSTERGSVRYDCSDKVFPPGGSTGAPPNYIANVAEATGDHKSVQTVVRTVSVGDSIPAECEEGVSGDMVVPFTATWVFLECSGEISDNEGADPTVDGSDGEGETATSSGRAMLSNDPCAIVIGMFAFVLGFVVNVL